MLTRQQRSAVNEEMRRAGREVHYPRETVDLLDPYILLVHQGMIEQLFIDDMEERGVAVRRNTAFMDFSYTGKTAPIEVTCMVGVQQQKSKVTTSYVIGCDGAHSQVRKSIPGAQPVGASSDAIWGVLDGQIETNFPDLWSKAVIYSEEAGSVLIIPRERNLTRLYIELKPESRGSASRDELTQEFVMHRAQEIMDPFHLKWKTVGMLLHFRGKITPLTFSQSGLEDTKSDRELQPDSPTIGVACTSVET